ncbi:MAG TPA: acetyl-CoA C-acyltransferase [Sorangium sp.]|nr:acetyl-CoA C-acyltransferase [Sorangium sp.]
MPLHHAYIVAAKRTPIGTYLGGLSSLTAPHLGKAAIEAALAQAKLPLDAIGEVFMGNVLSAGIGQAPARQASLAAGLSNTIPTTTVSKVCGSGLQAVILAARSIAVGDAEVVVAGGMECMSQVPYYLPKARQGYRLGDGKLIDGMMHDGLWDPYNNFPMGMAGELCASEHNISRESQDAFAKESYRRALAAADEGRFDDEIVTVAVPQRKGEPVLLSRDEEPARGKPEKFAKLRPAFKKDGTITAANASSLNDGASALVLASEKAVKQHQLQPLARIEGYAAAAQAPEWFTTAPAVAMKRAFDKLSLTPEQVGLYEINEAFSVVTMVCGRLCELDPSHINVNGGAVALGHPIGASGARILTTLLYAMQQRQVERGMASICIGGGEALALVLQRG